MPQYAVLMYAPDAEGPVPEPTRKTRQPYDLHSTHLQRSGAMVAAFALEPRPSVSIRPGGLVTDGPFTETKELIAGFYVLEADDLDAAVAVAATNPILRDGGRIEVRSVESAVLRPT